MRVTVSSLETAGAVSGEADPTDGRQTILSLTPAFRKTLKTSQAAWEDWLVRALQAQLPPREREQLATAVVLLNRLADF
jgi:DNA-binding MarR family transcriptional regulator